MSNKPQKKVQKPYFCSRCMKQDKTVKFTTNPYKAEIEGDDTKHFLCEACIDFLQDEI